MTILLLPLNTGILLANSKIFNNNNQNGIVDVVMDFTLWLECRQSTTDDKRSTIYTLHKMNKSIGYLISYSCSLKLLKMYK